MQLTTYLFIGKKSSNAQETITTDDRNSENIETTFSTFVDEIFDILDQQNFDKIQRKCLENVNITAGSLQLSKEIEQKIEDTRNVGELFKVMCRFRPYWNWMNIRILEKMAGNCLPAKELIRKYKNDVYSRKVKDVISEISNLEIPTGECYTEVKEKFKKDFDDLLIGDIAKRWNEIEKRLNVKETMLLKSITDGCVEICWLLRNDLVDHAIYSATSGHSVSQSGTQEEVEDDYQSVTQEAVNGNSQSVTREFFAEVLYFKIGDVVIKDDTTGVKDDTTNMKDDTANINGDIIGK